MDNPYLEAKKRFNELAVSIYGDLDAHVQAASDPLSAAVRLVVAGNVIDMGVDNNLTEQQVHDAIEHALEAPLVG